ncbi:MAG: zinc ribbon domain-containing protein [Elusimicrobiaceae bacterium]|nr:zinc ribbon domain-containing protein [Elusimicrobiaceae bacterium]
MDFTSIILGALLTAVAYLIFPLLNLFINDGKFPKEKAHKIALWNSIVLGLIFCVITIANSNGNVTWNAAPAVLYYWINRAILTKKDADEALHVNDKASSNAYSQGDPCVKQHIYFNKEQVVDTDEVRFCRKCGERLIDDGVFCHKCGTKKEKQAIDVDEIQFCPKCGEKIIEGGAFCHKCGAKIVTASEEKISTTDSFAEKNFSGKPIMLENGLVKCPACNYVQAVNRKVCWKCSYKFDNEKINTSVTHTQRRDNYGKTASQSSCEFCGKQFPQLTYSVIKDALGTRYRNLCDDCITKYNAKPKDEEREDSVILEDQPIEEETEGIGGKCELCGKLFPKLTYSTIKDDMGTRYRNICDDCIAKYNAKPKR